MDAIGVKINSPLLEKGKIKLRIRLPYPTGGWGDMGNNFTNDDKHQSSLNESSHNSQTITHGVRYYHLFCQPAMGAVEQTSIKARTLFCIVALWCIKFYIQLFVFAGSFYKNTGCHLYKYKITVWSNGSSFGKGRHSGFQRQHDESNERIRAKNCFISIHH